MAPAGGRPDSGAQERGGGEQTREKETSGRGGNSGVRGLGGHRRYTGGGLSPISPESRVSGTGRLCWVEGWEAEGGESITRGSHKDRDRCPDASHGTIESLAVQRTNETLGTHIYRGPGGGQEVSRGRDQEDPSVTEIHSMDTETLSWGRELPL